MKATALKPRASYDPTVTVGLGITADEVAAWWSLDQRDLRAQQARNTLLRWIPQAQQGRARGLLYEIGILTHLRAHADEYDAVDPTALDEEIEGHLERLRAIKAWTYQRSERLFKLAPTGFAHLDF